MDAPLIQRLTSLWKKRPKANRTIAPTPLHEQRAPGFALEPRIMLDAALVSTGAEILIEADTQQDQGAQGKEPSPPATNQPTKDELAEALESINPPVTGNEVFLIDPSVPDYETLVAGIPDNAQVHILSSSASLEEIAGVLSNYQNLDAVHIISHGSTGSLSLSGETVNFDSLEASQEALADIGRSLNDDGDILLYGCNVGTEGEGQNFIEQLAELTGADVAASDDMTGKGGDWELEVEEGDVTALSFSSTNYQRSLADKTFNFDNVIKVNDDGTVVTDVHEGGDKAELRDGGLIVTFDTDYDSDVLTKQYFGDDYAPFAGDVLVVETDGDDNHTFTIAFNNPADVKSLSLSVEAAGGPRTYTLTPDAAAVGSAVTTVPIAPLDNIEDVQLNWSNVSLITITASGTFESLGFDNLVLGTAAPANTAPTLTGQPTDITVTEDTPSNLNLSTATFADTDAGDSLTVTLAASAGTMTASSGGSVTIGGSGTGSLTLSGTATNINTYLDTVSNIKYTGAQNASGDNAAMLTISATDGEASLASNPTVNIDITAQNDAPTITGVPTDVSTLAETASNLDLSATTFADVDGDSLTVTLSASTGTMTASSGGGVIIGGSGSGSLTLSGTAANINSYLDTVSNIQYTGASGVSGDNAATLTISASDGDTNLASNPTVNIDLSLLLSADGDMAFTRYNADNDNEGFSFVVLVDLSSWH